MTTESRKRLIKDFKQLTNLQQTGVFASPQENNMMLWEAIIFGPEDTIWDGGCFKLFLEFTEEYPIKPPNIKFRSQMFHPNRNYSLDY